MQSLWLIVVVFFLIIAIIPIFAKAYVTFDFLNNIGVISLYVFCFKVITYKAKFEKFNLVLYTNKGKTDVQVEVSSKQLRFLKQLSAQLKQKIILKNLSFYTRFGLLDAYATAIVTGIFNSLISAFMGYIKNTKKSAKMQIFNNPNYNGSNFTIVCNVKCFVTLFDVIYSLLMSFIIIKRSEKYERV